MAGFLDLFAGAPLPDLDLNRLLPPSAFPKVDLGRGFVPVAPSFNPGALGGLGEAFPKVNLGTLLAGPGEDYAKVRPLPMGVVPPPKVDISKLPERFGGQKEYTDAVEKAKREGKPPPPPPGSPRPTGVPAPGPPVPAAAPARTSSVGTVPAAGGPIDKSSRTAFLQTSMPYFQQIEAQTGIPAEAMAAIAINEGATTPGTLAYDSGAPFGIKSAGQDASGNDLATGYPVTRVNAWEVIGGRNVTQPSAFVNFPDPATAIQGFVSFLERNPRYAPALEAARRGTTPQEFTSLLHQAGYATDPAWTTKITSIAGEAARYRQQAPAPAAVAAPVAAELPALPDLGAPATPNAGSPFQGAPFRIAFDVHQRYDTPLPGGTTHHRGVDIVPTSGGLGTPVNALAGGTVVDFRQGGAQGNAVVLQAADGLYHAYFHLLDRNTLAPGTYVQPGQQINRMGQSGSEGFPHLHLEVRRRINGDDRADVIDPLAYFGLR